MNLRAHIPCLKRTPIQVFSGLTLLVLSSAVPAADLIEVYQRALQNDPQIREADANRLASRESKPQALAALLPQLNVPGSYTNYQQDASQTRLTQSNPADPDSPLVP